MAPAPLPAPRVLGDARTLQTRRRRPLADVPAKRSAEAASADCCDGSAQTSDAESAGGWNEAGRATSAGCGSRRIGVRQRSRSGETSMALASRKRERQRGLVRQFFRALGPTKEWAENNYYQLPLGAAERRSHSDQCLLARLRGVGWEGAVRLRAPRGGGAQFLRDDARARRCSICRLTSPKHTTKTDGGQFTLTAAGPLVAFHKEIKPAARRAGKLASCSCRRTSSAPTTATARRAMSSSTST